MLSTIVAEKKFVTVCKVTKREEKKMVALNVTAVSLHITSLIKILTVRNSHKIMICMQFYSVKTAMVTLNSTE